MAIQTEVYLICDDCGYPLEDTEAANQGESLVARAEDPEELLDMAEEADWLIERDPVRCLCPRCKP